MELAEQDKQDFNKEQTVSPALETDKQANSVPPSVNQQGTLPAPKFQSYYEVRPYHMPNSATHMANPKLRSLFTQVNSYVAVARSLSLKIRLAEKQSLASRSTHVGTCKLDYVNAKRAMDDPIGQDARQDRLRNAHCLIATWSSHFFGFAGTLIWNLLPAHVSLMVDAKAGA